MSFCLQELSPEDRQRTAHLEVCCGCPCHKLTGVKACDTDRTVTNERLRTSVVVHQTDGAREISTIRRPGLELDPNFSVAQLEKKTKLKKFPLA